MTPEAQRIAIAEACGWTSLGTDEEYSQWWLPPGFGLKISIEEQLRQRRRSLPDYLTDLNAMHEAEKALRPNSADDFDWSRWDKYHDLLAYRNGLDDVGHVTAKEKAECFLRALGRYQD